MRYEIKGESLPVVVCHLEAGEKMVSESGAMSFMSPNMQMETAGVGFGKVLGRMFSGESMFQNTYTAQGGEGMIAFASSFPGAIVPVEIAPGKEKIVQKSAFLAAEDGVDLSVHIQKRFGAGFFGGEGFIMQKLSGYGTAFIEVDGAVLEYDLAPGQKMVVNSGCLAAMDASCTMEIEQVPGLKNKLLGGEGLFHTVVSGPGKIWIQTMPIYKLAAELIPYMPTSND